MELTGYTEDEVEGLVTALSEALHNDLNEPDDTRPSKFWRICFISDWYPRVLRESLAIVTLISFPLASYRLVPILPSDLPDSWALP